MAGRRSSTSSTPSSRSRGSSFDDSARPSGSGIRRLPRRDRPLAGRAIAGGRTRGLRGLVGDRRAARVHPSRVGPDVQALDGQTLELGPLLQCSCAGRARRGSPSTSFLPRSTTRMPRARSRTRSRTRRCSTTIVKPPIHGWALAKLRAEAVRGRRPDRARRDLRPGCPPGPDSGWTLDGFPATPSPTISTATTAGGTTRRSSIADRVVEAPDLAAFLIIQLDVLADLADELGIDGAAAWRAERDALASALVAELWDGDRFVARGAVGRASREAPRAC